MNAKDKGQRARCAVREKKEGWQCTRWDGHRGEHTALAPSSWHPDYAIQMNGTPNLATKAATVQTTEAAHDNLTGPCACGAWHDTPKWLVSRLNALQQQVTELEGKAARYEEALEALKPWLPSGPKRIVIDALTSPSTIAQEEQR